MAASFHITKPDLRLASLRDLSQKHLETAVAALVVWGRWTMVRIVSGVRVLQLARLTSTLFQLRDDQLEHIGITRSEIPQYAKSLMTGDRGGD